MRTILLTISVLGVGCAGHAEAACTRAWDCGAGLGPCRPVIQCGREAGSEAGRLRDLPAGPVAGLALCPQRFGNAAEQRRVTACR